jgi:hypothetical protein
MQFGCVEIAAPETEKLTDEGRTEYLQKLQKKSGLQLTGSSELLYHNKETRSPFFEEWIILSKTAFELKSLNLSEKPLEMDEPDDIESLKKVLSARIPTEKIEGPMGSQSFEWAVPSGEYRGNVLRTKKGYYLWVELFPRKS